MVEGRNTNENNNILEKKKGMTITLVLSENNNK